MRFLSYSFTVASTLFLSCNFCYHKKTQISKWGGVPSSATKRNRGWGGGYLADKCFFYLINEKLCDETKHLMYSRFTGKNKRKKYVLALGSVCEQCTPTYLVADLRELHRSFWRPLIKWIARIEEWVVRCHNSELRVHLDTNFNWTCNLDTRLVVRTRTGEIPARTNWIGWCVGVFDPTKFTGFLSLTWHLLSSNLWHPLENYRRHPKHHDPHNQIQHRPFSQASIHTWNHIVRSPRQSNSQTQATHVFGFETVQTQWDPVSCK